MLKGVESLAEEKVKAKQKSTFREYTEAIFIALLLALFIRTFVVQAFKIPSGSMLNTLLIGDHILVNKFIYGVKVPFTQATIIPISNPKRGDIVVFRFPEDPKKDFIKRVVGIGGDVVEIKNKQVYVNQEKVNGDYDIKFIDPGISSGRKSHRDNLGPISVPEDALFVMGDNRDNSHDSRFWGFVDVKEVKGKAFMIYWSWNNERFGVRWSRLGDFLR